MKDKFSIVRKPAVAGQFYPDNPVRLTKTIAELYAEVEKVPLTDRPLAIITPHAGYPYSGRVAAKAYKLLEGEQYDTVVIVSPSHTVFFKGSSVFNGAGYETPLGVVDTNRDLTDKVTSINPSVYLSNMGHSTGDARGEHALEVQLPFLQVVLGKFKLVAIVMGDQEEDSIHTLGETLASALKGTNCLLVASTDLSHFHTDKEARRLDFAVQSAIEQFNPDLLVETLSSGKGEACGGGPTAAVMLAAKRLGASEVKFLEYATSGDITGDFSEVVGYLSAAIVGGIQAKPADPKADRSVMGTTAAKIKTPGDLTDDDKQQLHSIAREAITAHLEGNAYEPPQVERLDIRQGVFVTLKIDGHLRGCIGQIMARQSLYKTVAEMGPAAAFDDPRFPPVTSEEFDKLEYEISVLSSLERVHDFSKIKVGRDGLMIKLDMHSGLLLPQVATEYGWNTKEFLQQTCLKAGLPKESYKDKFAEVYKFSAEVF